MTQNLQVEENKSYKNNNMKPIDPISKHAIKLANKQRFHSLKNSIKTMEQFIIPSCSPDMVENFDELKDYLLKMYKP